MGGRVVTSDEAPASEPVIEPQEPQPASEPLAFSLNGTSFVFSPTDVLVDGQSAFASLSPEEQQRAAAIDGQDLREPAPPMSDVTEKTLILAAAQAGLPEREFLLVALRRAAERIGLSPETIRPDAARVLAAGLITAFYHDLRVDELFARAVTQMTDGDPMLRPAASTAIH
jgi:hypothetical protein